MTSGAMVRRAGLRIRSGWFLQGKSSVSDKHFTVIAYIQMKETDENIKLLLTESPLQLEGK